MTLQEIVRELDRFELGMTIYAANPWEPSTKALVARSRDGGGVPDEAVAAGCCYFLDVAIALAVVSQFTQQRSNETEKCARLIEYAEWLNTDLEPESYPFLEQKYPVAMLIRCSACGKHFDIVIADQDSRDHPCPACGQVQVFDFDAVVNKALVQSRKMFRKTQGRQ